MSPVLANVSGIGAFEWWSIAADGGRPRVNSVRPRYFSSRYASLQAKPRHGFQELSHLRSPIRSEELLRILHNRELGPPSCLGRIPADSDY